jgi:hypothetical protein
MSGKIEFGTNPKHRFATLVVTLRIPSSPDNLDRVPDSGKPQFVDDDGEARGGGATL